MKVVVVSPHFDDAVLSCWSVIDSDAEVAVVTVFTACPTPGVTTGWDADTGVDSATRMLQRIEENEAALALAGARVVDLGFLEAMYEGGGVDPATLKTHLAAAEVVYVPAGIGVQHVNPEHVVVRDACLSVRPDARLYADQPYSLFRADSVLPAGMSFGLERSVVSLSPEQRQRKAEAIACYAGEIKKLEGLFGPVTDPARLMSEIFWIPVRDLARQAQ